MTAFHAEYAGRTVCVTGGAGFIGSHLVDALADAGAAVRVIDDLSTGRRDNLAAGRGHVTLINASILDPAAVAKAVEGVSVVFHLAAIASVPRSVKEPEKYLDVNVRGTQGVLEASRTAGVGRFVFASSSSVYGDQPGLPRHEQIALDPRSPYAASKASAEHLVHAYGHCYGMATISLRYFNIFGPRQRPDTAYAAVVPRFADLLQRGERPVIYGDGTQTRDFTYVLNAVQANLRAGVTDTGIRGDVVNIACGEQHTVIEVLHEVARHLGLEPRCDLADPRPGEVQHSLADIAAARARLGYEPEITFKDGLARTVDAMRYAA